MEGALLNAVQTAVVKKAVGETGRGKKLFPCFLLRTLWISRK